MNRSGKKKAALLLTVCLLLGLLAGCGKKDDNARQLSATVYVPKYLDLNFDADYISGGCSDGEYLYLIGEKNEDVTVPGSGNGESDEYTVVRSTYSIYRVSLADGTAEKLPGYVGPAVPDGKDGSNSVRQIAVGADGTLWVTESLYVWGDINYGEYDNTVDAGVLPALSVMRAVATAEFSPEEPGEETEDEMEDTGEAADVDTDDIGVPADDPAPYVDESYETTLRRQLDKDGNELRRIDLSNLQEALSGVIIGEEDYLHMQAFDDQGNLYVGTESKIYALDGDMSVRFTVEGKDMWYDLTTLGGGLMGMQSWEYDEATETGTNKMKTIDPEKRDWGVEYILPSSAYNIYPGGGDYLFYYQINDSIYGFKAGEPDADGNGTGEGERLFSWIEADINSENVRNFFFLPDGRVAVILQEWDRSYEHMNTSVVVMSATPRSELPEKTTLVYATLYLTYNARRQILDFNKRSEAYRIEVRDYSEYLNDDPSGNAALQKLNTEILAGNVPDILDTNNMPVRQYGAKDILEDLWPYIDKDPELGRDKLMVRPLEANQQDGRLYEIFCNFTIRSVAGPARIVGDRTSWTLADLREALTRMPEGCTIFGVSDIKDSMLNTLISLNMDQFVDWKTGACGFDSPDFKALLEFCNSFPAEFKWEEVNWDEWEEQEGRIMTGKQMLMQQYLSNFGWNFQCMKAVFNGDYSFVGYPKEDGGCGSSFVPSGGVAMTSACRDKDGAWSFIRQTLLPMEDDGNRYYGDFPINKTDFDRMVESVLNSRYETDKDGNLLLDDDGNPIPMSYGSMWVSEDVQIDLGPVEQSDIDKVMDLYNTVDSLYRYDERIMDAVSEVASQYFAGDKPLDETASLIQNKVKLYIGENM